MYFRKSQYCHKGTVGRKINVKDYSGKGSERKEESWRDSPHLLREHINNHRENVSRIMDVKGHSGEISSRHKEQVIENRGKADPCYKVAKNLAELCSSILWKVKFVGNEIVYLTEEISKQSIESMALVFLTAYSNIQKETDELKKESLSKRNQNLKYLENSQPIHFAKK